MCAGFGRPIYYCCAVLPAPLLVVREHGYILYSIYNSPYCCCSRCYNTAEVRLRYKIIRITSVHSTILFDESVWEKKGRTRYSNNGHRGFNFTDSADCYSSYLEDYFGLVPADW